MGPRKDRPAPEVQSPAPQTTPPPGRTSGTAARNFCVAAAVLLGAAVPLGRGWHARALAQAPSAPPPVTTPRPGAPPSAGPAGAAPGSATSPAAPVPAPPPKVDPRVARALDTLVQIRAGTLSLRTVVRRLGVQLVWPEKGDPEWYVDPAQFDRTLRRLARRVERPARSARLMRTEAGFHTLPAQPGRRLDRAAARQQLLAALARPAYRHSLESPASAKPLPIVLSLSLHPVAPAVTGEHFGSMNTLLATYSTSLGGSSRNRRHNIRVACEAIDGTVLMPGEVFSYNDTVGPRSERAGFRRAPVIIHGELVPGTGGGVCQVSTTLYNVALLGDLKIVRRTHHHFPVHYVPPGRDATVAYGSLDLRFANTLPRPVALDVKEVGGRVVVHLFGSPDCKRQVELISRRVGPGRVRTAAVRPGKRVVVTRVVRLPDGTVRREVVSRDSYAPAPPPSSTSQSNRRRGHRRLRRMEKQEPHEAPAVETKPVVDPQPLHGI